MFLKQRIIRVFDNGSGMGKEEVQAFASYFLSQKDRGLERGATNTHGYLDGRFSLIHFDLLAEIVHYLCPVLDSF